MILARHRASRFLSLTGLILLILLAAAGPLLALSDKLPLLWLPFLALPPSLLLATVLLFSEEERSCEALALGLLGLGPLRRALPLSLCAALLWMASGLLPGWTGSYSSNPLHDQPQGPNLAGLARLDLGPSQKALLGPGTLLLPSKDQALILSWDAPPRWVALSSLHRSPQGLRLIPRGLGDKRVGDKGDTLSLYPDRRSAALRRAFLRTPPPLAVLQLPGSGWATPNLLALWSLLLCLSLPFFLSACTLRFSQAWTKRGTAEEQLPSALLPWLLLLAGLLPTLLGVQLLLLADGGFFPWLPGVLLGLGLLPLGTALILAKIPFRPSLSLRSHFRRRGAPKNFD